MTRNENADTTDIDTLRNEKIIIFLILLTAKRKNIGLISVVCGK